MKYLVFFVGLMFSVVSLSDELPQTVGIGSLSCKKWNQVKNKPDFEFYAVVWLQGFISGANTSEYLLRGDLRDIHGKEYSYYSEKLKKFCDDPKNKDQSLSSVAINILVSSETIKSK